MLVSGLPMLGYMEQSVATALTKALTAVGCFKPKYPFVDAKKSALLYIAYHLKGKWYTVENTLFFTNSSNHIALETSNLLKSE